MDLTPPYELPVFGLVTGLAPMERAVALLVKPRDWDNPLLPPGAGTLIIAVVKNVPVSLLVAIPRSSLKLGTHVAISGDPYGRAATIVVLGTGGMVLIQCEMRGPADCRPGGTF